MQNNSHYILGLIKRQWIREEYVASDLFTLDVIDDEFIGGYKPMVLTMETFKDFILDAVLDDLSFLILPDTPNSYTGSAGQTLIVNAAEDALIYADYIDEFTELIDTPPSYALAAGQLLIVNPGEDALIYADYIDTFLELTDTPISYGGAAGQHLVVNAAETAVEFIATPVVPTHYEARLTFSGALDPVVSQLLRNQLSTPTTAITITWSRISQGRYQALASSPVNLNYWSAYIGQIATGPFVVIQYFNTGIVFEHYDTTGSVLDVNMNDVCVELKLHYP